MYTPDRMVFSVKYQVRRFVLGPNDADRRIDRILRSVLPEIPLSALYRLFREKAVFLSGVKVNGSARTHAGDILEVRLASKSACNDSSIPEADAVHHRGVIASEALRFSSMLLVETPDLAIVNKPRGILTHGPGGIDVAAHAYYADLIAQSLAFIPAPLHRLDRNTSGALAISSSSSGATRFSEALRSGLIEKTYLALLSGKMIQPEAWHDKLQRDFSTGTSFVDAEGKNAVTQALPLISHDSLTLAYIQLDTGRTHQIRVQASAHGYPLAGDVKYGGSHLPGGYMLHCAMLGIPAGIAGPEPLHVFAPLPDDAKKTLSGLFGKKILDVLGAFQTELTTR
jgi:23S rRNA pseudouridine955/2504/2580 synthase